MGWVGWGGTERVLIIKEKIIEKTKTKTANYNRVSKICKFWKLQLSNNDMQPSELHMHSISFFCPRFLDYYEFRNSPTPTQPPGHSTTKPADHPAPRPNSSSSQTTKTKLVFYFFAFERVYLFLHEMLFKPCA